MLGRGQPRIGIGIEIEQKGRRNICIIAEKTSINLGDYSHMGWTDVRRKPSKT
jgi:hypothetical protein